MVKKILFVCTGNTCRSSMAEAIARNLLTLMGEQADLEFGSAGVAAFPGMNASAQAINVLQENGTDLTNHCARLLTGELVQEADLILTMTKRHAEYVITMLPEAITKTFTLREFAYPGASTLDIADPFGGSKEVYQQVARELEAAIREILTRLHKEDFFSTRQGKQGTV